MAFSPKFDFDPEKLTGIKVRKEDRADALEEVADFVKEQILSRTADGKSSVKGGRWVKGLTPKYAERKSEESSVGYANLELTGDLLDALDTSVVGKRVRIEITDSDQYGKAEGHITGQYGKKSRIRPRQFMPQGSEQLSPEIQEGIREILRKYEEE